MKKIELMRNRKHMMLKAMLAAAMLASFMLTACGEEKEKTPLQQGMDCIASGDYAGAQSHLSDALSEGENEKTVKRAMGLAAMAAGDNEGAQGYFKEALECSNGLIDAMDIDINYYLAVSRYNSGNPKGAIEVYDAIINMRPDEYNAYYMRGKVKLSQGDKTAAIADYNQAISLEKNDYDQYIRICEDLRNAGYASEGEGYIRQALESNSKLSQYQQGVFNYYLGDYNGARNCLENARADKDKSGDLILYLGRTYESLGDADYAISLYEDSIAGGGASAAIYIDMGLIRMHQGRYQEAIDYFESGLALGDGAYMQPLMYNKIVAYEYMSDFATAKSLMAEYVQKYPGDEAAARENIFLSTR